MKKSLLTLSLIAFAFFTFANQSSLRIFSENNTPFYIYLNGVQQNYTPTSDFQMNGLFFNSYRLQIRFAQPFLNHINESNLLLVDANGNKGNVVYKVGQNHHGKMVLRFVRFDALNNVNNHPITSSCGEQNGNNYSSNTTIIQNGNGNTVIYSSSNTFFQGGQGGMNDYSVCYNNHPMNFQRILSAIDEETFSDDQLQLAKRITQQNCLTANQIERIAKVFTFEDTRLKYLKFAYAFCHDKNNYWVVNDALTFSSSKRELNEFILD